MATILEQAASYIKAGGLENGKKLLVQVLQQNPSDENAWLRMSRCVPAVEQKKECFPRVLNINANNPHAIQGLRRLNLGQAIRTNQQTCQFAAMQVPTKSANPMPLAMDKVQLISTVGNLEGEIVYLESQIPALQRELTQAQYTGGGGPLLVGLLLCLTGVGAILGIPLLIFSSMISINKSKITSQVPVKIKNIEDQIAFKRAKVASIRAQISLM